MEYKIDIENRRDTPANWGVSYRYIFCKMTETEDTRCFEIYHITATSRGRRSIKSTAT